MGGIRNLGGQPTQNVRTAPVTGLDVDRRSLAARVLTPQERRSELRHPDIRVRVHAMRNAELVSPTRILVGFIEQARSFIDNLKVRLATPRNPAENNRRQEAIRTGEAAAAAARSAALANAATGGLIDKLIGDNQSLAPPRLQLEMQEFEPQDILAVLRAATENESLAKFLANFEYDRDIKWTAADIIKAGSAVADG